MHYLSFVGGGSWGDAALHRQRQLCLLHGHCLSHGTFIINITGSTVMGLIAGYLPSRRWQAAALAAISDDGNPRRLHDLLGVLADTALLYERGEIGLVALYVLGSVVLDCRPVRWALRWCAISPGKHGWCLRRAWYGVCFAFGDGLSRQGSGLADLLPCQNPLKSTRRPPMTPWRPRRVLPVSASRSAGR